MKKVFLTVFLSILSLQLYSLPSNLLIRDSVCYYVWDPDQNAWIDSTRQIFKYDENLNLLENLSCLWIPESGDWVGSEDFGHQTWSYDENGNLTEHLKYKWDPVKRDWILSGGSRKEITYDNHGHIILEIFSDYYPGGEKWIISKKTEYIFNDKDKLTEKNCYLWNNILLVWEGDNSQFRQTWTYDKNGNKKCHIYYHWNRETRDWEAFSKFEYNYNENAKIIEKTQWKWDPLSMKWTGVMRHTWKYYLSPIMTEVIQYDWLPNLSVWFAGELEVSLYNESSQLTAYTEYSWDNLYNKWKCFGQRCIYIYDENGNLNEKTIYYWDENQNCYIKSRCWKNEYDESGNQIDSCFYYWDTKTESWTGSIDQDCLKSTYDANGNLTEILYYHWDIANRCWNYSRMEKFQHDQFGKRTEWSKYAWDSISNEWFGSCPECINIANNPCFMIVDKCGRTTNISELIFDQNGRRETMTEIHYQWNFENKDWDYSWKMVEYWSEPHADVYENTLKSNDCKIYPNPAGNILNIEWTNSHSGFLNVEIINIEGITVYRNACHTEHIDVSGYARGLYFVKLIAEEKIYTAKIIFQ